MIIYRVENSQGEGMYSGENNAHNYMRSYYSHPAPYRDDVLAYKIRIVHPYAFDGVRGEETLSWSFISENLIFGFSCLDQLKRWISEMEWLDDLDRNGFKISVYECEEAYCGYSQAVIMKNKKRELLYKLSLLEV